MAESPTFDPRYDPAFQRGYQPPSPPQQPPTQPDAADPAAATSSAHEATGHARGDAAEAPAARRGVNPYVGILWAVGVILTVGGTVLLLAGYYRVFAGFSVGLAEGQDAQLLYVLSTTFAVPLVTVGLGTIVGLIFLLALRAWRRREGVNS